MQPTALITGATSGIGALLARAFIEKGYRLIYTGRDQEALSRVAFPHLAIQASLEKKSERGAVIEAIHKYIPDLVINNAGYALYGKAIDFPVEEQLNLLKVLAEAPLEITLEAAAALKKEKKKGVILNIASAAAFFPSPLMSVYGASKSFLVSFSRALDFELKSNGIRCLVSCPGQVATDFQYKAAKKQSIKSHKMAMSPEVAVKKILMQIEKHISVYTFTTRYRLASSLIPKACAMRAIAKTLKGRLYGL